MINEMVPAVAAQWLAGGATVLDVREVAELELAVVPGTLSIPMSALVDRVVELDPTSPIAVLCHHGIRSRQVAIWLDQLGFAEVHNVSGGIAAWADIDTSIGRY